MTADLLREAGRKTFHMLSLVYLAAYYLIGYPLILKWLSGWAVVVVAVETARLYLPGFNDYLFKLFRGLSRPEERGHYSGVFHTTIGALAVIWLFGDRPAYVAAGIWCVSLGDAAAALVGKAIGRLRLPGSKKSVEGSTACFVVCAAACLAVGFPPLAAAAGALAATVVELLPTTWFFNDNLWMPLATAVALRVCAG
jgi:dolichol kinase